MTDITALQKAVNDSLQEFTQACMTCAERRINWENARDEGNPALFTIAQAHRNAESEVDTKAKAVVTAVTAMLRKT